MAKVIILNGPQSGGKDTAANYFVEKYKWNKLEFKAPLTALTKRFFNVTDERWNKCYTEKGKNLLREWLVDAERGCISQRQALIHVSENVMKPVFGKDIFGKLLADSIDADSRNIYIVSDGGFVEELIPVINKVGKENVCVVRIHRDGCSFAGDSRNYLPDGLASNTIICYNNLSTTEFFESLEESLFTWMEEII